MPGDANAILIDVVDLASGNDGNGSGSTPTTAPGAVINVTHGGFITCRLRLGEAEATIANAAETLDVILQIAVDGSTFFPLITFRQITASEISGTSGTSLDESAGGVTFRREQQVRVPRADDGQEGLVKMRLNTVASSTAKWALFVDVVDLGSARDELLTDNVAT